MKHLITALLLLAAAHANARIGVLSARVLDNFLEPPMELWFQENLLYDLSRSGAKMTAEEMNGAVLQVANDLFTKQAGATQDPASAPGATRFIIPLPKNPRARDIMYGNDMAKITSCQVRVTPQPDSSLRIAFQKGELFTISALRASPQADGSTHYDLDLIAGDSPTDPPPSSTAPQEIVSLHLKGPENLTQCAFYAAVGHFAQPFVEIEEKQSTIGFDPAAAKAQALARRARSYANEKNWKAAIAALDQAIASKPSADLYNERGIAHSSNDDPDAATRDYNEAIRLDANNPFYYYNRATTRISLSKQRLEQPLDDLDSSIRLNPDNSDARNLRGNVYFWLGRLKEAVQEYDAAIKLDPNNPVVHENRANALDGLGRSSDAASARKSAAAVRKNTQQK